MAGGMSWTENWLQFDNSYYKRPHRSRKEKEKEKERERERRGKRGLSSQEVSVEDHRNGNRRSLGKSESSSISNGADRALGSDGTKGLRCLEAAQEQVHMHAQSHSSREGVKEVSTAVGDASCSDSNSNCSSSGSRSKRRLSSTSSPSVSSYCPFSGQSELLWLPTDDALCKAPEFKFYFEQYAADQKLFFSDYALAHRKMSELGARFDPPEGIGIGI